MTRQEPGDTSLLFSPRCIFTGPPAGMPGLSGDEIGGSVVVAVERKHVRGG